MPASLSVAWQEGSGINPHGSFEVGDELTDTMKLKRAVVYKKYMEDIKAMYQSKNAWRDVE